MLIDPNGWCDAARPCLSPNHDARPAGAGPDLVILLKLMRLIQANPALSKQLME